MAWHGMAYIYAYMINISLSLSHLSHSLSLSLTNAHTHSDYSSSTIQRRNCMDFVCYSTRKGGLGWGWGKGVSILCQILLFQKKINYKVTNRKRERERVVYYYILQKDYHGSLSFHHHPISFTVTLFFSPLNSPSSFFLLHLFFSHYTTPSYIYTHTRTETHRKIERERFSV